MSEQKIGERCACADSLNFGEPQPDCSRCGGTGTVKAPEVSTGPIFEEVDERIDFLKNVDRGVERLREYSERMLADLTPAERAIVQKRRLTK
jgi:hypothetical protein